MSETRFDVATLLAAGLRGLRYRSLLTLASLVLVALAVAAAVVAPMYASGATASYLVTTLRAEPFYVTGVTLDYQPKPKTGLAVARHQAEAPLTAFSLSHYSSPELSLWAERLAVDTWTTPNVEATGAVTAQPNLCRRLVIVTGHCPTRPDQTLVLRSDATLNGTRLGDPLQIGGLPEPLTVVGTYRLPTDTSGWYNPVLFTSAPPQPVSGGPARYLPAPFVVDASTFARSALPGVVRMDFRLRVPANTTLTDLQAAVRQVKRLGMLTRNSAAPGSFDVGLGSELPAVTRQTEGRRLDAQLTVLPAAGSLIVVALVLLLRLSSAAMDLRRPELALAALRGIGRRQLWMLGMTEPGLILLLATPIGIVSGFLGARALARIWLVPGLPVPFEWSSVRFAVGVLVAAVVVAALTVRSVTGEPLSAQISAVRRPVRPSRWSLLGRLTLIAATVAVLASTGLATTGKGLDAADLVLPILLAGSAGLVTTILAAGAARWWAGTSVGSRGLAGYLAARTVSRRREGAGVVLPITTALAIAVFAGAVYTTAANWRASVAATTVGSGMSFNVELPMAEAETLTRQVDPKGRWLMAASADYSSGYIMSLVDSSRMARVMDWPQSWTPNLSVDQVAHDLGPAKPPLVLAGRTLQMTVNNQVGGGPGGVLVSVDGRAPNGGITHFFVGPFPRGTAVRSATAAGCASGCEVTGITISGPGTLARRMSGQLAIRNMRLDGHPVTYFTRIGWRGVRAGAIPDGSPAVISARTTTSSLRVVLNSGRHRTVGVLAPEDVPGTAPVLVGRTASPAVTARRGDVLVVRTTPGESVRLRRVGTTESTPLLGPAAMLADYTVYSRSGSVLDAVSDVRILARSDTPPAVLAQLAAHGVASPTRLQVVRRTLDQEPYALALNLYLVVTALVMLLAITGLCVNLGVQLPGRRRDAASLRVVGVPRRSIFLAAAGEYLVLLASAAVAGVVAGAIAESVVVRTLTLGYVQTIATPRVTSALDLSAALRLVAAALAVLLVVAALLGTLTIRAARTATLRESAG